MRCGHRSRPNGSAGRPGDWPFRSRSDPSQRPQCHFLNEHSLQLTDVVTGWSERVMNLGRSQRTMEAGFTQVLARVSFSVRELHPDNGSDSLDAYMLRFVGEAVSGLRLSRSC